MKLLKTCNASDRAAAPPMYSGPRNTLALSPPPLPPYAPLQPSRTAQSQLVMSIGAAQYSAQALQQQQLSWQTHTLSLLPGSTAFSTTSAVDYGGLSPAEPPSAATHSVGAMAMRNAAYSGGRSGRGVHSVPATPVSEMLANASMRSQGSGSVFTDGLSSAESGAGSNEMLVVMNLGGGGGAGGSAGLVARPGSSASSLSRGALHLHHNRPSGLHADLLAAADNVTSAVTSLVRELNSEAESDGEGAERDRDTSASEPEPDPAELADPQLQSRLLYPGMHKFALLSIIDCTSWRSLLLNESSVVIVINLMCELTGRLSQFTFFRFSLTAY